MGTAANARLLDDELGIVPRVIQRLFDTVESRAAEAGGGSDTSIHVSFIEIYREELKDLLHPETSPKSIAIRETSSGSIQVTGVREEAVANVSDMWRLLQDGSSCRSTGSTLMNDVSSRSHAIFSIKVHQRPRSGGAPTTAKFHLVDLAGSERAKRTGAAGMRFKESVNINQGLLALGNVISALGDPRRRASVRHVPYRESKLTRMLQDSLGGNSRTVMIACISPADNNFEETLGTLKYANRARNIKNRPIVNVDTTPAVDASALAALQEQVLALQTKLEQQGTDADIDSGVDKVEHQKLGEVVAEMQRLQNALDSAEEDAVMTSERLFAIQSDLQAARRAMAEVSAELTSLADVTKNHAERVRLRGMAERLALPETEWAPIPSPTARAGAKRPMTAPAPAGGGGGASVTATRAMTAISEGRSEATHAALDDAERARAAAEEEVASSAARIAELEATILKITSELNEAREDLKRDEEIFEAKQASMAEIQGKARELHEKNEALREALITVAEERDRFENQLTTLQQEVSRGDAGGAVGSAAAGDSESKGDADGGQGDAAWSDTRGGDTGAADDSADMVLMGEDMSANDTGPLAADGKYAEEAENQIATLLEELASVEDQRRDLEEKVRDTEEARSSLEDRLEAERREHQRTQQELEENLRSLSIGIRLKEEVIKKSVRNEIEATRAAEEAKARVANMEKQVSEYRTAVENAAKELRAQEAELREATAEARTALQAKVATQRRYMEKLKNAEKQLNDAKRQLGALERLQAERRRDEKRIDVLESEVARMRNAKLELQRKLKSEEQAERAAVDKLTRELARVRREADLERRRAAKLSTENERQRTQLQTRAREVLAERKALSTARGTTGSRTRRSTARTAGRTTQRGARPRATTPVPAAVLSRWKALDAEVTSTASRQMEASRVAKLQRRKSALVAEREAAESERVRLLEAKRAAVRAVRASMDDCLSTIRSVEAELTARGLDTNGKEDEDEDGKEAGAGGMSEARALRRRLRTARSNRATLAQQLREERFLPDDQAQALSEVEERVEALDAEIEFQQQEIEKAVASAAEDAQTPRSGALGEGAAVGDDGRPLSPAEAARAAVAEASAVTGRYAAILKKVDAAPAMEVRELLRRSLKALVVERERVATAQTKATQMELQLQESQERCAALETSLRRAEMDFDRRLTTRQQRHEAKLQRLLTQMREEAEALAEARAAAAGHSEDYDDDIALSSTMPARGRGLAPSTAARSLDLGVGSLHGGAGGTVGLQKEIVYYKTTNRALRRQLRQAGAESTKHAEEVRQLSEREQELARANTQLMQELTNLKAFLHAKRGKKSGGRKGSGRADSAGGAPRVRVSRSLREVDSSEIAARMQLRDSLEAQWGAGGGTGGGASGVDAPALAGARDPPPPPPSTDR